MELSSTTQPDPLPADELARHLPGYEVLSVLGQGGMGAVYLGRHQALDRAVAIKVLTRRGTDEELFRQRFLREARSLAQLSHPGIVQVYDSGQTADGRWYFMMEFVDGTSLQNLIAQRVLTSAQALAIVAQVCDALACAHAQGIVHRDIKPANILVDSTGRAVVTDFGIARILKPEARTLQPTQTGVVIGTPDYMAPEQLRGEPVGQRADIYSLGVLLYEMLCGDLPRGIFALPSQRMGSDRGIDRIVSRALQQRPELRFRDTLEMKAALEAVRAPPRRARPWVLLAMAGMIVSALVVWWLWPKAQVAPVLPPVAQDSTDTTSSAARRLVEWVLTTGNDESYVAARIPGTDKVFHMQKREQIPAGEWEVVGLWFDRLNTPTGREPVSEADFVAHTASLTKLRHVFVRQVALSDTAFTFLAANPDLERLTLEGVPVTNAVLGHLTRLEKIWDLNINGSADFTGHGLEQMAALSELRVFIAYNTRFDDAAARVLATAPRLRHAHLAATALTDTGLRALMASRSLEELCLDLNAISDTALAELARMKSLRRLLLNGTPVSEGAVAAFRRARPDVVIVR
jgi:serine/threonine protein kinase